MTAVSFLIYFLFVPGLEYSFAKLNPIEKSLHSFKEIGNDFWDGLEARNEKKFDSLYDFRNYLTVGSFNTTKALYQGMEDRAHVALNSPYDFANYVTMGTLDLGNGAINPEESFLKEHWLSSVGLASIIAGGAKPIVPKPKTPSLQDRNLVLEQTVNRAHELAMKPKADFHFLIVMRLEKNDLIKAEERLRFKYPTELREFYLEVGYGFF